MAAIRSDNDVVVSRIKNRFDPNLDSDVLAGYRNLAVNLRIVTPDTLLLGVDMHICEVQLLLLSMAAIKVRQSVTFNRYFVSCLQPDHQKCLL